MSILNDITIGRFVPSSSPLHRLDPRAKMMAVFCLMIATLVSRGPLVYLAISVFLFIITDLAHLSFTFIYRSLRPFIFFFSMTVILYLFVTEGHSIPPFPIWRLNVTYEGLANGLDLGFRLILLIWGATLLTLTTSPMDLTDGLERMLRPLKRLKLPVGELAMMVMIAIKFIPILLDEADLIIKAQRARGAGFDSGGPLKRARNIVPIVVPMLIGVFRRADDLATAMEARCYQPGAARTHFKVLRFERRDWLALGVMGVFLAGVFFIRHQFGESWVFWIK